MIYLIRHGETEANIRHIYCGSTDLPLSDEGIEKLMIRRDEEPICRLREKAAGAICITSGMKRTEQTFRLLFGDLPYSADPRFSEIDFGIFEMKSYDELKDRADYQEWISGDNESNVCPGGESGRQMEARVIEAFREVESRCTDGRDAVIVCHGGVIAAIMSALYPNEGKTRFDWQPVPAGGYAVCRGRDYMKI